MKENEEITFNVKFAGTPKPEAKWSIDSKVIIKSPKFIPSLDEDSAQLTIKKVVDEDGGDYTIKLSNPVGDAADTLHLIILSKSYYTTYTIHNLIHYITLLQKNQQLLVLHNQFKVLMTRLLFTGRLPKMTAILRSLNTF